MLKKAIVYCILRVTLLMKFVFAIFFFLPFSELTQERSERSGSEESMESSYSPFSKRARFDHIEVESITSVGSPLSAGALTDYSDAGESVTSVGSPLSAGALTGYSVETMTIENLPNCGNTTSSADSDASSSEVSDTFFHDTEQLHTASSLLRTWQLTAGISGRAMDRLLQVLEYLPNLPKTQKQLIGSLKRSCLQKSEYRHFCEACQTFACEDSRHRLNASDIIACDIKSQVKRITKHNSDLLEKYSNELQSGRYTDVLNSDFVWSNGPVDKDMHLYFLLNADGASFFTNSDISIWPLTAVLLNLPPIARQKIGNMILIGIISTRRKPDFKKYLPGILNDLPSRMYVNETCVAKLHFDFFVCDLPAMSSLFMIKQFNGEFSCPRCLNPGYSVRQGLWGFAPNVRAPLRTAEDHIKLVEKLQLSGVSSLFGVSGKSPLLRMIRFPDCLVPDSLHMLFEGQVKYLLTSSLDSKNRNMPFFIRNRNFQAIDDVIQKVRLPHGLHVLQSLKKLTLWKAKDFKNFALYFLIPVYLPLITDGELRKCLYCLISIYHLLYRQGSDPNQICALAAFFMESAPSVFTEEVLRLNFHLLEHVGDQYKNFGPLYSYSMFQFESAIKHFRSLTTGTRYPAAQIAEKFLALSELCSSLNYSKGAVKELSLIHI